MNHLWLQLLRWTKHLLAFLIMGGGVTGVFWAHAQEASAPQIRSIRIASTTPEVVVDLSISGPNSPAEALPFFQLMQLETSPGIQPAQWQSAGVRTRPASSLTDLKWTQTSEGDQAYFRVRSPFWHTPFPDLTGSSTRVGYMSRHVTSPTRTGFDLGTNRSFMVSLFYPTGPSPAESDHPLLLYPPQFGIYLFTKDFITVSRPSNLITNLVGHAMRSEAMDRSGGPYPVLLYGHGGQWFRHDNAHKAAEMASRGYVVVALDFYDAFMSVLPDGQLAIDDSTNDFPHTRLSVPLHQWGVLDTRFLLDTLEEWNRSDPFWAGMFDMDRVGVWGWSFGGAVMADAARVDPRVKAAMLLDAAFWSSPDLVSAGLHKPFFCLQSELAPTADWSVPALTLFDKNRSDAYFLKIAGSRHIDFCDLEMINRPNADSRRYQSYQIRYTSAFFDRYLRQVEDPLLEGPAPGDPNFISWQKK